MKQHKRRLPTGVGLHRQALRQSVALRGDADCFKAFFGVRRRHFARDPRLARQGLGLNDSRQLVLRNGASATYHEPSEFQAFFDRKGALLQWSAPMT
jgi:hypothetical protein